ncbi:hypothetical protein lerEdw1_018681 [Lerista edwardsae]|nr:hypothetical protein lerEdw1_018681 [Lerista edwardsae]
MVRTLQKELYQILPENSHQMATGRLFISLTRLVDGQNVIVSEYGSKQELVQALLCSCFLPVYVGFIPPSFRGVHYIDGGFSNLQPHSDLEAAITVSPFTGEIDICPRDCPAVFYCLHIMQTSFQFSIENLCRLGYSIFPPNSRVLDDFYAQGYQDAIFFLHRHYIFEIGYVAKTATSETIGAFHKKDLFHTSEGGSCQETGRGALNAFNGTTSADYSKQSDSVTSNMQRISQGLIRQLPSHGSKAVLHALTRPGLQHLKFMKPPTRMALALCKRLEQLWQLLKEISWFGRHFGRTQR